MLSVSLCQVEPPSSKLGGGGDGAYTEEMGAEDGTTRGGDNEMGGVMSDSMEIEEGDFERDGTGGGSRGSDTTDTGVGDRTDGSIGGSVSNTIVSDSDVSEGEMVSEDTDMVDGERYEGANEGSDMDVGVIDDALSVVGSMVVGGSEEGERGNEGPEGEASCTGEDGGRIDAEIANDDGDDVNG